MSQYGQLLPITIDCFPTTSIYLKSVDMDMAGVVSAVNVGAKDFEGLQFRMHYLPHQHKKKVFPCWTTSLFPYPTSIVQLDFMK
jgi:hypothetical protein